MECTGLTFIPSSVGTSCPPGANAQAMSTHTQCMSSEPPTDMRTTWVQKRVCLEALDDQALTRSIGTFEQALRVRSGAILVVEREHAPSSRQVAKIVYEFPIKQN